MKAAKRILILCFLLLIPGTNLFSRPLDKLEALNVAKKYLQLNTTSSSMRIKANLNLELAFADLDSTLKNDLSIAQNYYYVFNIEGNNGFIIVSADTRTKKILGYSNEGQFNYLNIPDNMKSWLKGYEEEIKFAINNLPDIDSNSQSSESPSKIKSKVMNASVSPLLKSISYNQNKPYNDSCPLLNGERTVTGCGATALVQIMRYHQWPVHGLGANNYISKTNGFNLGADFGNTTYDWNNILDSYGSGVVTTNIQKAAIAQLMLHAGIAIKMDYNTSSNGGSISYTTDIAPALFNYFNYDAGIQMYTRRYFKENVWKNIIISELDSKRPVLYRGGNINNEGHIFVCDGYDSNEMFHFNWGWGGISNGYFEISALNPDDQSNGNNIGYNFGHYIITGIQKPIANSVHSPLIGIDSISPSSNTIPRNGTVVLSVKKMSNIGAFDYLQNMMGVSLVLSQGGVVKDTLLIDTEWGADLHAGYYYSYLNYNVQFDSMIPNGDYQISVLYRNEKNRYVPTCINTSGNDYLIAKITDSTINFSQPEHGTSLTLTKSPVVLNNLYQNKTGQFEISVKNGGTKDYYAQIGIKLTKSDNSDITQNVINSLTSIPAGETKTIQFGDSVKVDPGDYLVNVYFDGTNNQNISSFPTSLMESSESSTLVTVNVTPSNPPILSILNPINFPTTVVKGQTFSIGTAIQNTGDLFEDNVIAFVFPATPGMSLGYFGYQKQIIDRNQIKTIDFTGEITGLDAGDYRSAIYYYNGSGWTRLSDIYNFTLSENVTPVINTKSSTLKILSNPVATELKINLPENIKSIILYNIQGNPLKCYEIDRKEFLVVHISDLASGIYILQAMTNDGEVINTKWIKK